MPKAPKSQPKSKQKTVRPHVVSFRMSEAQYSRLQATFKNMEIIGVDSTRQFARKIVCDFIAGRLHYKNAADKDADLEYTG